MGEIRPKLAFILSSLNSCSELFPLNKNEKKLRNFPLRSQRKIEEEKSGCQKTRQVTKQAVPPLGGAVSELPCSSLPFSFAFGVGKDLCSHYNLEGKEGCVLI